MPCDVCSQRTEVGVCSSGLGPLSLAYCQECANAYAEPEWLCAATIEMCDGVQNVADWVKDKVTFWRDGQYLPFALALPK